uniref:Deoxyribonuclease-2-alpha n=1 Tax=Acanthochromis polyacanthus TaxID=80966 RepID=A0A3Q1GEP0_9TELE
MPCLFRPHTFRFQGMDCGSTGFEGICRNDSGAPVDWYILYKLPSKFGGGLKYLYMDEHSTNGWRLSTKKINESGALRNTLEPLLDCYDKPVIFYFNLILTELIYNIFGAPDLQRYLLFILLFFIYLLFGNPGRTELLPSVCTTPHHHVYNVKRVKLSHRVSFSDTVDHSKWCVTEGGTFTCIADLNRMESQKKRGGGALCTTNHVVGRAFIALIEEPCVEPEGDAEHTEQ